MVFFFIVVVFNLWGWDEVEIQRNIQRIFRNEGSKAAGESVKSSCPRGGTGGAVGNFLFCSVCWNVKKYY